MNPTLKSIAENTGTSCTTVSRVLSGQALRYGISKPTAEKILLEAKSCGYEPSPLARSLQGKRSGTIGLIVPLLSEQFFATLSSLIIEENALNGYTTLVAESHLKLEQETKAISSLLRWNIDGLLICPCGSDRTALSDIGIPTVQLDRYIADTGLEYVTTDNRAIGYRLTKTLLDSGHRKVVALRGTPWISCIVERVEGYCDAMKEAGLEPAVEGESFDSEASYRTAKELMLSPDRPSAIVALSNAIALGVLKAANELGIKLPEELSIVAADDNKYMRFITPTITRMAQPMDGLAKSGCNLLYRKIRGEKVRSMQLPPILIPGDSVAYRPVCGRIESARTRKRCIRNEDNEI